MGLLMHELLSSIFNSGDRTEISALLSWRHLCIPVLAMLLGGYAHAQDTPAPKHEFRGAWIATYAKLDWPRSISEIHQKNQMTNLLDYLEKAGINAVFFQVRSLGDAMYASRYEPWSHYLTGDQARSPTYDPLKFVIGEAHRRGMELHAWINPYRVHNGQRFNVADNHITVTHPEWTYPAGNYTYLDPGRQDVRSYVSMIVMDIARHYEIDGIHLDDYFYPYPPNHLTLSNSPDIPTFQRENRGFTSVEDWRRDNINLQIAEIADSLRSFNPALKFGISPFGIWKSGIPRGVSGLNAYHVIFADATNWLQEKTIDYLVPQLYWRFGGEQDYAKLARWWAVQSGDRHLYIGHALYRAGTEFSASEVPNQVAFNRNHPDISGSVFFRTMHFLPGFGLGFAQTIRGGLYQYPALPPSMDWKDMAAPPSPLNLTVTKNGNVVSLDWESPDLISRRYAVYRIKSDSAPDPAHASQDARNLIAITGETEFEDNPGSDTDKYWYFVQSVSSNSIESEASNQVSTALGEERLPDQISITTYPTVFRDHIQIEYSLSSAQTVTLQVYDTLGRNITTLISNEFRQSGQHTMSISSSEHLSSSGLYWLVLSTDRQRAAQAIIRTR